MGGTISVTLRKKNGDEYRMSRWTNSMPWGIGNVNMLRGNEEHINKYLNQWFEMKEDYEANKDSGNFEYNMTDAYFPSAGLVPDGYGLVVVDHVNKVILDLQGYTSFDYIGASSIGLELPIEPSEDYKITVPEDGDTVRFKEFLDAGLVKGVVTRDSYDKGLEYESIDGLSFEDIIHSIMNNKPRIFSFILDLDGWEYEKFEECDPNEIIRYKNRLIELGFDLSDEENKMWDACVEEYRETYGDDE